MHTPYMYVPKVPGYAYNIHDTCAWIPQVHECVYNYALEGIKHRLFKLSIVVKDVLKNLQSL